MFDDRSYASFQRRLESSGVPLLPEPEKSQDPSLRWGDMPQLFAGRRNNLRNQNNNALTCRGVFLAAVGWIEDGIIIRMEQAHQKMLMTCVS